MARVLILIIAILVTLNYSTVFATPQEFRNMLKINWNKKEVETTLLKVVNPQPNNGRKWQVLLYHNISYFPHSTVITTSSGDSLIF